MMNRSNGKAKVRLDPCGVFTGRIAASSASLHCYLLPRVMELITLARPRRPRRLACSPGGPGCLRNAISALGRTAPTERAQRSAMKFQNRVNALSEAWNRCTTAASVKVGGCSMNEISGIVLARMTRISSQTIVPSTRKAKTGDAPTKTLAKPLAPGWNGSDGQLPDLHRGGSQPPGPARPRRRPSQAPFLPPLSSRSPAAWMAALTTIRPMISAPCHIFGAGEVRRVPQAVSVERAQVEEREDEGAQAGGHHADHQPRPLHAAFSAAS